MPEQPTGEWRCRACGEVWDGSQLYQDPSRLGVVWTCGNLFCGGTCDRVAKSKSRYAESWQFTAAAEDALETAHELGWRWCTCPDCGQEGMWGRQDRSEVCPLCGAVVPSLAVQALAQLSAAVQGEPEGSYEMATAQAERFAASQR